MKTLLSTSRPRFEPQSAEQMLRTLPIYPSGSVPQQEIPHKPTVRISEMENKQQFVKLDKTCHVSRPF
jgi:hypothetical protein